MWGTLSFDQAEGGGGWGGGGYTHFQEIRGVGRGGGVGGSGGKFYTFSI